MISEIAEKTERIVKMLAAKKLGGVLLNSQPNFAWATAGAKNGVDQSRENGAASLLIRNDGKRFVLAGKIEMPRVLAEELSAADFEPIEFGWEEEKASPDFLINLAVSLLNNGDTLGTDLFFNALTPIVEGDIARCRFRLTNSEIERFRRLGKDAGEIIGNLIKNLRGGESENEVARQAADALGAKNIRSIVTLVAAAERLRKFRHPVPTEKCWEKVLMLVVCARRHGLIVSLSRIVCLGEIPDQLRRRTDACARVDAKMLAATKPGATGAEIYRTAAAAYAAENFAGEINLHHQGGATGYKTRDWVAHPKSPEKVEINQAFVWNPSITGTKTEETCIVFENGIEIITASPDYPQIAVEVGGREYAAHGVFSL